MKSLSIFFGIVALVSTMCFVSSVFTLDRINGVEAAIASMFLMVVSVFAFIYTDRQLNKIS